MLVGVRAALGAGVLALALLGLGSRALAAAPTVALTTIAGGGGNPTDATAILYADGFDLAWSGGSQEWQTVYVRDVASNATVAVCPGTNCTVTAWYNSYVQAAFVTGLLPNTTYSVYVLNYNNFNYGPGGDDLSPDLTTGPAVGALSLSGPSGYPPANADQIDLTVASDTVEPSVTWTITQEQLGPGGGQVALSSCPSGASLSGGECLYSLAAGPGASVTLTTSNQQAGGPGYVYRYVASTGPYSTAAVLFANAPTFYVHRRTRGLFVTWPDEGNGTQYDVFGGPGSGGCASPSFNQLLPAGTAQLALGGLEPNTQYALCLWAEIPNQPVTAGGWLPTWWVAGGNANSSGMWYTLPDVPGQAATGGLLAAYYDVPALAGGEGGPATTVFADNADYTEVQGPIDFAASCNCASSWPYVGYGGPMPAGTADGGSAQGFAAKLLGWLYAPASGSYRIGCRADDACQVWVNGSIVADGMTGSGPSPNYYGACNACGGVSGSIALTAGDWYPLELDYTQGAGGASLDLYWTPPGGATSDVPASDLAYPVLTGAQGGSYDNATLAWASNGNPAGTAYQLQRQVLAPTGAVTGGGQLYQGTASSFTTTDLQAGEVSAYFVRAISGDGFATPYATEPGGGGYLFADAPAPTVASPAMAGQLTLTWPDLGNGAHYAVIWSTESSYASFATSGDLGSGVSSYTASGLAPNTEYYLALDAWIPEAAGVGDQSCTGGSGGGCWWSAATDGGQWTLAEPPVSLQASGAGSAITLSWGGDGNPPDTQYRWSVSPQGGSAPAAAGAGTALQAVASGLSCQTDYTGSVSALNGAGLPSAAISATAETGLCPPAPEVGLAIDNGLGQTSTTSVTLDVSASDVNYAQAQLQMRFSNDGSSWSAWQPYAATAAWTIKGAAGPNTVYVQVQDPDGGTGSATAAISYDSSLSPLSGTAGQPCSYRGLAALCVNSPLVTAAFAMPSGSVSMEVSFDNADWSQPEDARAAIDLVLPGGSGLKAVFARYFGQDDVATAAGPDYFVLATAPPAITSLGWLNDAAVTDAGAATLVVQASDAITAAGSLQVSVSGAASWSGALPAGGAIPLTLSGSGYVSVTVTVTDQAGNSTSQQIGIYNP